MKRILSFESFETSNLLENLGEDRWPSDWKSTPEWKTLRKLGFYEATTPIQMKNGTIMIKNSDSRLQHFYPQGIVLQQSGYIRDKGVSSGFIKSFSKSQFSLSDLFNHVIDKTSAELNRFNKASETTDLTPDQINRVNASTKASWNYNKQTKEIDVNGEVLINVRDESDKEILNGLKFGTIKGDFIVHSFKNSGMKFLPRVVGKSMIIIENSLKNLEGFPEKIADGLLFRKTPNLESLYGIFNIQGLKYLATDYFSVKNPNPENLFEIIENSLFYDDTESCKTKGTKLIMTALTPESIAPYFKLNPLKIHVLDNHPELKREVLKLTGLRDLSQLGRSLDLI